MTSDSGVRSDPAPTFPLSFSYVRMTDIVNTPALIHIVNMIDASQRPPPPVSYTLLSLPTPPSR